jgi:hypothetical protein
MLGHALTVVSLVAVVGSLGAPQPPHRHPDAPKRAGSGAVQQRVVKAPTDSATVRRPCVAPDSVLAGRAACVLRNQAAFRVF